MLILDSGAASTRFSARYTREFPYQFAGAKQTKSCISGAGGTKCAESYELPQAELKIGNAAVAIQGVPSLREDLGTDKFDSVYGNAGGTLLNSFKTYTIDFKNMRFIAGELLQ